MRADALSNLGALALKRGEPRQALWYLQRAAKGAPAKPGVRYNHALALHRVGRDGEALSELRAAEAADPADAGVRFLAGVVALRLGLIDEAVGQLSRGAPHRPQPRGRAPQPAAARAAGRRRRSGRCPSTNGDAPEPAAQPLPRRCSPARRR